MRIGALRLVLTLCAAGIVLLAVPAAQAGHQFTDVPNDHQFHEEIGVFKDTNITSGCTATTFCPLDVVRRQAMAAFIGRALGLVLRPGEPEKVAVPGSKIAMIDDGTSEVRSNGGGLELSYAGERVLRLEGLATRPNIIGGFEGNLVSAGVFGGTIAGGGGDFAPNRVRDDYGAVGGGRLNVVGDGAGATDDRAYATVGGGYNNMASGSSATVGGGSGNTASHSSATVGGGGSNTASGSQAVVAGGGFGTASGTQSMVLGGFGNTASGTLSFAAGAQAKATHPGSFVWGDFTALDIGSYGNNTFTARTTGGARFVSAVDGTGAPTAGVTLAAGGGSWAMLSDRAAKRDFRGVDGERLLRDLARLPIHSWSYRSQRRSIRHMGPTAQDFRRAFGLGEDARHITGVDADGVALAAIQALHAENRRLRRDVERLRRQSGRLAALERAVARLTMRR